MMKGGKGGKMDKMKGLPKGLKEAMMKKSGGKKMAAKKGKKSY